jgi:beta-glucosidase
MTAGAIVAEVVQLYAVDPVAQVSRPVRSLLGFAKVELDPGERAEVHFEVHTDRLAFTSFDGNLIVEPGEVHLDAGSSSLDTPTHAIVEIVGRIRTVEAPRRHHVPVRIVQAPERP